MFFAFIMSMWMGAFGLGFPLGGNDTFTVWMALLAAVLQFAKTAALARLIGTPGLSWSDRQVSIAFITAATVLVATGVFAATTAAIVCHPAGRLRAG
jgi:hypothetical protein